MRKTTARKISLQSFGGVVQELGEFYIIGRNALCVVGGEVHCDAIVDVEPFRVMIHLLNRDRGSGHEAERMDEVGEFKFPVELSVNHSPFGKAGERFFQLGA